MVGISTFITKTVGKDAINHCCYYLHLSYLATFVQKVVCTTFANSVILLWPDASAPS